MGIKGFFGFLQVIKCFAESGKIDKLKVYASNFFQFLFKVIIRKNFGGFSPEIGQNHERTSRGLFPEGKIRYHYIY